MFLLCFSPWAIAVDEFVCSPAYILLKILFHFLDVVQATIGPFFQDIISFPLQNLIWVDFKELLCCLGFIDV